MLNNKQANTNETINNISEVILPETSGFSIVTGPGEKRFSKIFYNIEDLIIKFHKIPPTNSEIPVVTRPGKRP